MLILVSAIGAPIALTSTLTKGASFAGAQLQQVASMATKLAEVGTAGGGSLALSAGRSAASSSFSSFAGQAAGSMSGAAARLAPLAAAGGPAGLMASLGMKALGGAAHAMQSFSLAAGESAGGDMVSSTNASTASNASMMTTMGSRLSSGDQLGVAPGAGESAPNPSAATAPIAARRFRRNGPVIDV